MTASCRPVHAARPCAQCPWRRDVPVGQFSTERFEVLRDTCGRRGDRSLSGGCPEAGLDAPMFACHKSAEGKEIACAGWLAVEGHDHLGVRLSVLRGRIPGDVLQPKPGWPELFGSYDEMARAQADPAEKGHT